MTLSTAPIRTMGLDEAMVCSLNDPLAGVAEALNAHRWALAHLLLVKHVPTDQRRAFVDRLASTLQDPLVRGMVTALSGKEVVERCKEAWPVSPLAHVGYFQALAPHYARLAAVHAIGLGQPSWTWSQRQTVLDAAVREGLALQDLAVGQFLVLEALRCPSPEVWGWLDAHGLLAVHAGVLRRALRDGSYPSVRLDAWLPTEPSSSQAALAPELV